MLAALLCACQTLCVANHIRHLASESDDDLLRQDRALKQRSQLVETTNQNPQSSRCGRCIQEHFSHAFGTPALQSTLLCASTLSCHDFLVCQSISPLVVHFG